MLTLVRLVEFLALSLWLGAMVFFVFWVAPAAFATLPSRHLAGTLVGWLLPRLHLLGAMCGIVFLAALVIEQRVTAGSFRTLALPAILVLLVLLSSAVNHYGLSLAMAELRAQMSAAFGGMDQTPVGHELRTRFARLHGISSMLMLVNLVFVFSLLAVTVRRLR